MKHEALIRAMSEIDERFIDEAHEATALQSRMPFIRGICAAAACLLLCCIVIMQLAGGTRIKVFGETIPDGSPVYLSEQLPATARLLPDDTEVSIPLELRPGKSIAVTARDGSLSATDAKTGELISEGNSFSLTRDASVYWHVSLDDKEKTLELNITERNQSSSVLLRFDGTAGDWVLTITKN